VASLRALWSSWPEHSALVKRGQRKGSQQCTFSEFTSWPWNCLILKHLHFY